MKRMRRLTAGLCLLTVCLSGCGAARVPENIETSTLVLSREGQVTLYLVEDFGEAYYDAGELSTMAKEEVAEFNEAAGVSRTPVMVEAAELIDNNKVRMMYRFPDGKTYTGFGMGFFFFGTVQEAEAEGLLADVTLQSVKDASSLTEEQLNKKGSMLFITDRKADVYCPDRVTGVSAGVSVNGDGSVSCPGDGVRTYILMK